MGSFGDFKLLEKGLGQSGYSAPNWADTFSLGSTFNNFASGFGDVMGKANDHFSKNKDLYNFGGTIASKIGEWDMSNQAAKEAKKMNDFYKSQYTRQNQREEDAEENLYSGFANSKLNGYGA